VQKGKLCQFILHNEIYHWMGRETKKGRRGKGIILIHPTRVKILTWKEGAWIPSASLNQRNPKVRRNGTFPKAA